MLKDKIEEEIQALKESLQQNPKNTCYISSIGELQKVIYWIKQEEEYKKCENCKYRPDIDAYNECNGFGKDEYCSRFKRS